MMRLILLSLILLMPFTTSAKPLLTSAELIEQLDLEAHVEGGFYRRTFQAEHREKIDTEHGPRYSMTSIYYLLTNESTVGHFHLNRSDIMHVFQLGDPLDYYLIYPDGKLQHITLGQDIQAGQKLQFVVPGGVWKASSLNKPGPAAYGLITEVVTPGFDFSDMTLGDTADLITLFPQHEQIIKQLSKSRPH